jgi:hypothetical protein
MVGDLPPAPGEGPTTGPPPGPAQWAPAFPIQPPTRPRTWPAIALAALGVLLGAIALVVAFTRPTGSQTGTAATTSAVPTYTSQQIAAAHQQLCSAFALASDAVKTDSSGDRALGRIALTNGAALLDAAVTPALPTAQAGEARALANAYRTAAAVASSAAADDPRWQASVNDVNVKSDALLATCHS